MGAFNRTRVLDSAVDALESDATKVSPTVSTTATLTHTLTHSPASNRLTEITSISTDRAINRVSATNARGDYTTQREGESESGNTRYFDVNQPGAATACTNDTFGNESAALVYSGAIGKDVTVRYKISVSSVVTASGMCAQNAVMTGRDVRVIARHSQGAFRGAF